MNITDAVSADLDPAVRSLVAAFGQDPITGFVLQTGPGYPERVAQFMSLLMQARIALGAPVQVAREGGDVHGAVMGYGTERPPWPAAISQAWDAFEASVPGMTERLAVYEGIAAQYQPTSPHWYLGVIGVAPTQHGRGIGARLLRAFCDRSAADPLSSGVYLETANPSNVAFYERAGFVETGRARMGDATLWCMFHPHRPQ